MPVPESLEDWQAILRQRSLRRSRELGIGGAKAHEPFTVTGWGETPTLAQLHRSLAGLLSDGGVSPALEAKLASLG